MRFLIHRPDRPAAFVPAASVRVEEIRFVDPTDRRALVCEWITTGVHEAEAVAMLCAFEARRCHLLGVESTDENRRESFHFTAEQWDDLAEEVRAATRHPAVSAA